MPPLTVHVGPGRLGLGLIVDVLRKDASFDVCLIARADGRPEQRTYQIAFADPERGLVTRDVQWACNVERFDDIDEGARARITSEEPLLITVALGGAISEREDLLRELLRARPAEARTLLLACENEPGDEYRRIAEDHPEVAYCPCVVDRICNTHEPARDRHGRRRFLVHPVAQWVIVRQPPAFDALTKPLAATDEVLFVDESDLDAYEHRKLWAVNGIHMLLALLARQGGHDELPLTDARAEAFLMAAQPLITAVLQAVELEWGLAADQQYAADRVRAFCESPDSASRVLRGRLVRANLVPLMARLNSRLGEAARTASARGVDCKPFADAAELLLETLKDRSAYLPPEPSAARGVPTTGECPEPDSISEAVDDAAVAEFAAFLDGWMEDDQRADTIRRLTRILAGQRED